MHFVLIIVLILAESDICNSEESQTLVCHFEPQYAHLKRVWCKKDSEECCTGFAFGKRIRSIDNGSVEIANDTATAFTVIVQNLNHGDGVYWCGLMFENETIMKLAEKYFSAVVSEVSESSLCVWSLLRWILFPLLPLISFSTCLLSRRTAKKKEVENGTYAEIPLHVIRGTGGTVTEE